jgi:hypothetical protein
VNPLRPSAIPAGTADTAGAAWAGRELPPQPFAGDDGAADPALAAALADYRTGGASLAGVVRALAPARVLVPVVALPGDSDPLPALARGDLGADLAIVTITGERGRSLPVFSAAASLARWSATARPVPVEAARAALAAVAEGCDLLLLDVAGPVPVTVPRPAVWALGQGRAWTPPASDDDVLAALRTVVRLVPGVLGLRLEPFGDAGVRVVLGIRAGLPKARLTAVVAAVQVRMASAEILAERADRVELKILPA